MKLLLLPFQFYLLPLNKPFEMLKVYERLAEINAIETWVTIEILLDCIKEYQEQKMGFELSEDNTIITAVKPIKWCSYEKKFI